MFKRILVPLDGSALAEQAIPTAGRIARATGGSVVLLRVTIPPVEYGYGSHTLYSPFNIVEQALHEDLEEAAHYLERIATSQLAGIETEVVVRSGSAAAMIFSVVDAKNIDLIVICTHGDRGLKRWVLGSGQLVTQL